MSEPKTADQINTPQCGTVKWFDLLSRRDLDNGAVVKEIDRIIKASETRAAADDQRIAALEAQLADLNIKLAEAKCEAAMNATACDMKDERLDALEKRCAQLSEALSRMEPLYGPTLASLLNPTCELLKAITESVPKYGLHGIAQSTGRELQRLEGICKP